MSSASEADANDRRRDDTPPNEGSAIREEWQEAVIESIGVETPTVKRFRLRPRHWRSFLAGQHIDIRLTAPDGYVAQRSYSVTSSPTERGILELAIESLPDGEVSPFFHEVAQVGDTIEVRGPFTEHFVWRPTVQGTVLMVAGGSGVAPFMSMIRQRAQLDSGVESPAMGLVYSARTWEDVIFRDELLSHERAQRALTVTLCLTRGAPRRPEDFARRVDPDILSRAIERLGALPETSYVCGRNSFVDVVASALVDMGLDASSVRTERYGGT